MHAGLVAHQQPQCQSRSLILLIFNLLQSNLDSLIDSLPEHLGRGVQGCQVAKPAPLPRSPVPTISPTTMGLQRLHTSAITSIAQLRPSAWDWAIQQSTVERVASAI